MATETVAGSGNTYYYYYYKLSLSLFMLRGTLGAGTAPH